MDRIQELLGNITNLSDDELNELRDLVMAEIGDEAEEPVEGDDAGAPAAAAAGADDMELSRLEELADIGTKIRAEFTRREAAAERRKTAAASVADFRSSSKKKDDKKDGEAAVEPPAGAEAVVETTDDGAPVTAGGKPEVPEDRKPKRQVAKTTVIRAGADIPGVGMGSEFPTMESVAAAMVTRINSMRGIRGGDGDKLIVMTAALDGVSVDRHLTDDAPERNLAKVLKVLSPEAITAAGGLAAPEEVKYDLFGVGDTDRPVRSSLPVFTTTRGGVRFMRPPTLNDVSGVVGIWTVPDDIAAITDTSIRKPSFRVLPGPEIVVDTQAITMIMTFGNLMSRAYPELVARHNELGLIAHARVAEQQLLTQIGALSTAVTGRTQKVGAVREVMNQVSRAAASYRNRHRIAGATPLRAIMPEWFMDLLRSDIVLQHPGDGLEIFEIADAQIEKWFRARNINITWAMDGEAGQDYSSLTKAGAGAGSTLGLADYPASVIWYLFAEGTFSFMDGGTLDLGLVRDSTLNAANDYQMFVETFENVVKFGLESLRVTSPLVPTGQGSIDVALT